MYDITISFETQEELDVFKLVLSGIDGFNGTIDAEVTPVEAKIEDAVEVADEAAAEVEAEASDPAEAEDWVEPETV